jgi:hypothetical protein
VLFAMSENEAAEVIARFFQHLLERKRNPFAKVNMSDLVFQLVTRAGGSTAAETARKGRAAQRTRRSSFQKGKNGANSRQSAYGGDNLKSGMLEKLSSGYRSKWQRRFFAMSGHYLKYYKDAHMGQVKGVFDLNDVRSCKPCTVHGGASSSSDSDPRKMVLKLETHDGDKLQVRGLTDALTEEWAELLASFVSDAMEANKDKAAKETELLRECLGGEPVPTVVTLPVPKGKPCGLQLDDFGTFLMVSGVIAGTPAAECGLLKPGDLLMSVDGRFVRNQDLASVASLLTPPSVTLSVMRRRGHALEQSVLESADEDRHTVKIKLTRAWVHGMRAREEAAAEKAKKAAAEKAKGGAAESAEEGAAAEGAAAEGAAAEGAAAEGAAADNANTAASLAAEEEEEEGEEPDSTAPKMAQYFEDLGLGLERTGTGGAERTRVASIAEGSPAEKSGWLKTGDFLQEVDGVRVFRRPMAQLLLILGGGMGDSVVGVTVSREGEPDPARDAAAGVITRCVRANNEKKKYGGMLKIAIAASLEAKRKRGRRSSFTKPGRSPKKTSAKKQATAAAAAAAAAGGEGGEGGEGEGGGASGGGGEGAAATAVDLRGLRASVFEGDILLEGPLKKLSSSKIRRTWQQRFFQVQGHYLKYFQVTSGESEATDVDDVRGSIDLSALESVTSGGDGLKITVKTVEGGELQLQAPHATAGEKWLAVLESFLPGASAAVAAPEPAEQPEPTAAARPAPDGAADDEAAPAAAAAAAGAGTEEAEAPSN